MEKWRDSFSGLVDSPWKKTIIDDILVCVHRLVFVLQHNLKIL